MFNTNKFIKSVVYEWSLSVPNGHPTISNENHLQILTKILKNKKIPSEAITEIIRGLRLLNKKNYTFESDNDDMLVFSQSYSEPNLVQGEPIKIDSIKTEPETEPETEITPDTTES